MIELEKPIKLTPALCKMADLSGMFGKEDLHTIGAHVKDGFESDLESRSVWEKRYQMAMDLALQLAKQKTFPWPGSSNIKFPLITVAAMQWHSRAYPALISGTDIVKMRVRGEDPDGKKGNRAKRVGKYMSWQVLEEDDAWEEETDRALIQLPIVGCVFKKTRRDSVRDINISETVSARDFVLNYFSRSVESSPRKTHVIAQHRNTLIEKMRLGEYKNYLDDDTDEDADWIRQIPTTETADSRQREDRRTGTTRPSRPDDQTPFDCLEQHVLLDLDGDDYAEPYIITVERNSGRVLRIVCGFEWKDVKSLEVGSVRKIIRIKAQQYFTKYSFLPSPDNGIYDMGLGFLLGPLNAACDSIINQMVDNGTLLNTAGGFLGKGIRTRGGEFSFNMFKWNRLDSMGEDIAKNVVPFPVRESPQGLFQLLGLLIDYTNRIAGSTDIMVGENPGQNTPAETSRNMVEQGGSINSAIFKRVWRCMKDEFVKMYELNLMYFGGKVKFGAGENLEWIDRDDFVASKAEDIRPAANPNLTSKTLRMQQATLVAQRAATTPGYDKEEVECDLLDAMDIEDVERLYPGTKKIPPPPPLKVVLKQLDNQREGQKIEARMKEKYVELMAAQEKNQADIELVKAQAAQIVAEIGADKAATQLKAFEAIITALQAQDEHMKTMAEIYQGMGDGQQQPGNGPGGPQGGAGAPPGGAGVPGMAAPPGNPGSAAGPGIAG